MRADGIRNVVDKLGERIRPLKLWPLEGALSRNECAGKSDAGQSSSERTAYTGGEAVSRRWSVEVPRQRGLVQAAVADARLIHPSRIGSPNPVASDHLGASVYFRPPLRFQLRKILGRSGIVSKEVCAANRMALGQIVIHLGDHIIGIGNVGEALHEAGTEIVVDRKAGAGARDRPSCSPGAAGN